MIRFENGCVGPCPQGCLGSGCPNRHEIVLECDECEQEVEELYDTQFGQLCLDCLREQFTCITPDNAGDMAGGYDD